MAKLKSVAKKLVMTFGAWIVGLVVLSGIMGLIAAFFVASLLALVGFVAWVWRDEPELGGAIAGLLLDPDGDFSDGSKRDERADAERSGREHLGRIRRGDPRDGT